MSAYTLKQANAASFLATEGTYDHRGRIVSLLTLRQVAQLIAAQVDGHNDYTVTVRQRDLAAACNCSRQTIGAALGVLEHQGVLEQVETEPGERKAYRWVYGLGDDR